MSRPVLLVVDDDLAVLRVIERDLRHHYGKQFRVLHADAGAVACDLLKQLRLRNDALALCLADQRMPGMSGVELLTTLRDFFPLAKRVLLTAYTDSEAAISAINAAKIDYYLLKPWAPPDTHLYPVLDDLLDEWRQTTPPPFKGVRVIGHRWSLALHQVQAFLASNHVPYQWLDTASSAEARRLLSYAGVGMEQLPLVLFADGSHLALPTTAQIAEKIGLPLQPQQPRMPFYDLVIVGASPAGLAAAIYGASEGLRTLLIEREAAAGAAESAGAAHGEHERGFQSTAEPAEVRERAIAQARRFGVEVLSRQQAAGVRLEDRYRIVKLHDGSEVSCNALLVATGVSYRTLDIPHIERLSGAGVFYGAGLTEAMACRDETVYIVGGGSAAGHAALSFARYVPHVVLLVRGDTLARNMPAYLIARIHEAHNIQVWLQSSVVAVAGEQHLESLTIASARDGSVQTRPATTLVILIGAHPRTDWLAGVVERDEHGFLCSGRDLIHAGQRPAGWSRQRDPFLLETSTPGIFVVGDARHGAIRRVAVGSGEGAMAIQFIHQYLAEQ